MEKTERPSGKRKMAATVLEPGWRLSTTFAIFCPLLDCRVIFVVLGMYRKNTSECAWDLFFQVVFNFSVFKCYVCLVYLLFTSLNFPQLQSYKNICMTHIINNDEKAWHMLSDSFYPNEQNNLRKDLPLINIGGVWSVIFLKFKHLLVSVPLFSPILIHPLFKVQCSAEVQESEQEYEVIYDSFNHHVHVHSSARGLLNPAI